MFSATHRLIVKLIEIRVFPARRRTQLLGGLEARSIVENGIYLTITKFLAQGGHFLAGIAALAVTNPLELPHQIFIVLGLNTRAQTIITSLTVFPMALHAVLAIEALAQVQVGTSCMR